MLAMLAMLTIQRPFAAPAPLPAPPAALGGWRTRRIRTAQIAPVVAACF